MPETVELLKAVALYLTPLVAIASVFATAWLAQRNWSKQFEAQYQQAILQERVKICQEIPDQLFRARMGLLEAWGYQAYMHALGHYLPELSAAGVDVNPLMSFFREKISKAMTLPVNTFYELYRSLVRVEIYFSHEAVLALRDVVALLQKASMPGDSYRALREQVVQGFRPLVEETKTGKVPDFGAAIVALISQMPGTPVLEGDKPFGEAMAKLILAFREQLLSPGKKSVKQ